MAVFSVTNASKKGISLFSSFLQNNSNNLFLQIFTNLFLQIFDYRIVRAFLIEEQKIVIKVMKTHAFAKLKKTEK